MLERLVQTQSPALNRWLRSLGEKLLGAQLKNRGVALALESYAGGLGISVPKLALAYFLPELASSLSKWLPGLPVNLLGCSSFLVWSEKKEAPLHGRILDFPLVGGFDKHERVLVTHFEGEMGVCSLSSAGLPFHSLSAINEAGVTMSLHQKFTSALNLSGESIFSLAHDLITKVENSRDLARLLKEKTSITTWNLIFTFADGQAVSLDLSGNQVVQQKFNLKDERQYLCNFNHGKWDEASQLIPHGFDSYNQMRQHSGLKKLAKFDPQKSDEKALLKTMSTLKLERGHSAKKYQLDCLTPSSLHAVVMNAKESTLHFNLGAAPKIFNSHYAVVHSELGQLKKRATLITKGKASAPSRSEQGYRHMILAQMCLDRFDKHGLYHHLQMAIALLGGLQIKVMCEFFLNVALFLDITHIKERNIILTEFKRLYGELPDYQNQLCALFIMRLERLMELAPTLTAKELTHPALIKMLQSENKIPNSLFYRLLRSTAVIRIDMLDVIHAHVR